MKATLILADFGQAADGKVNALGTGWNTIPTPTPPMSLLVFIDCPWDQTNTKHQMVIELLDADGHAVSFGQGPLGNPEGLRIEAEFETGRPPGVAPGSPLRHSLAINIGPGMPLGPGQKYEFHLTIDGQHMDSWLSTFSTLG